MSFFDYDYEYDYLPSVMGYTCKQSFLYSQFVSP